MLEDQSPHHHAVESDEGRLEETPQEQRTQGMSLPTDCEAVPRLSLNQITTYHQGFDEDLIHYREAGIGRVGVWRPKLEEFGELTALEMLEDLDMGVSSVSWVGGFTGRHGYAFDDAIREARELIRWAGMARAESVVIASGGRAGHTARHARRLLVEALEILGPEASAANVKLAVQPMMTLFAEEWTFLATIDETLQILSEVDHPQVGMAFDTYHLWREPNLLNRIRQIAHQVALVQLSDWHREPQSEYDRTLIGDGTIPLAEIVQAFEDSEYTGSFEISLWSEELWKSDYQQLLGNCRSRYLELLAGPKRPANR